MLNLESKFIENMNKSSLRNCVYNMNAVYHKNNANMLDNMNSNKCSGNVQLNKDPHSNNNNNNVNNNMTYSKRHTTFLILEQVQFLTVNYDSLLQWELVDVVDIKEEEEMVDDVERESFVSWAVASPIGDLIEGLNHGLLHLDDRFSEE
ncbi:hypothetical protein RYX36_022891 [Vicia faba]